MLRKPSSFSRVGFAICFTASPSCDCSFLCLYHLFEDVVASGFACWIHVFSCCGFDLFFSDSLSDEGDVTMLASRAEPVLVQKRQKLLHKKQLQKHSARHGTKTRRLDRPVPSSRSPRLTVPKNDKNLANLQSNMLAPPDNACT